MLEKRQARAYGPGSRLLGTAEPVTPAGALPHGSGEMVDYVKCRRYCMADGRLDRLLTCKDVVAQTKLSRSTIYRLVGDGSFPKPVRIGPRAKRWLESDIRAWLEELRASSLDISDHPGVSTSQHPTHVKPDAP